MLMLDKFTEIAALIDALKCLHSTESGSRKDENGNSLAEVVEPRKCCVMAWWFTVHLFLATHTHTQKSQPGGILESCDSERNENICSGIYHSYSKVKRHLRSIIRFFFFLHLTFLLIQ